MTLTWKQLLLFCVCGPIWKHTQLHLQIQQMPWIHSPVRTILALWQQLTKTEVSEPFIAEQTKSWLKSVMFGVSIVVKSTQELARDFGSQSLKSRQLSFCCVPFWEDKLLIKNVKFFVLRFPSWPEAQCWWGNAAEWRRQSRLCSRQVQIVCRCVHKPCHYITCGYDGCKWKQTEDTLCSREFVFTFYLSCDSAGNLWLWHDVNQICPQWQTSAHHTQ